MKALIFGAGGQDGYYLTELCKTHAIEPIPVSKRSGPIRGDVSDYDLVAEIIRTQVPELIFHLAARSTTSHSALFENHAAISTGSLNILQAVAKFSPNAR